MTYNLDGYVDVPTRIKLFMARHPEGSLQMDPPTFVEVEGKQWVIGRAYAYRTPDDARPGIGTAWEIVPGTTNFTRGSELQNLETSAWGRAIGVLGIGIDASIATLDRNPNMPKNAGRSCEPLRRYRMTLGLLRHQHHNTTVQYRARAPVCTH